MAMNAARQLLIDAGNSRIKAAFAADGVIGETCAWPLARAHAFAPWFDTHAPPQNAWMVSVADAAIHQIVAAALAARNIPLQHWRGTPLPPDLRNDYKAPTLGPDRLLAALAARRASISDVLVVASFGTATTVDVVIGNVYKGGLIAPGVAMMADSLNRNTAHLPLTAGRLAAIPDNTHDAIFSGICAAQRGAVMHALDAAATFGPPQLLVSGGAAQAVTAILPPYTALPDAVLTGLAIVACATPAVHSLK